MVIFFFIPQFWICKETHLLHCSIWIYKDMFIFFVAQSTSARMMLTFFIPQSESARVLIFFICVIQICKDSHLHLHCPIWICKDHVHLLWLLTFMQILKDRGSVCCAEDAHPLHLSIWICKDVHLLWCAIWICKDHVHLLCCTIWICKNMFIFIAVQFGSAKMFHLLLLLTFDMDPERERDL